jgi:hypothetical protein
MAPIIEQQFVKEILTSEGARLLKNQQELSAKEKAIGRWLAFSGFGVETMGF